MSFFSQRIMIGMLGPLLFQIILLYLYSSIRYEMINLSLFYLFFLLSLPIVVMHVITPFLLSYLGRFEERMAKMFSDGLEEVLTKTSTVTMTRSATRTVLNLHDEDREEIVNEIKVLLVPELVEPAVRGYRDTFYSRDQPRPLEIRQLEYFESLAIYSMYTFLFLSFNLGVALTMRFTSINLGFLTLDQLTNDLNVLSLVLIFVGGLFLSYLLFQYSITRLGDYLPYATPGLFYESKEKGVLRKELIRSLLAYNYDDLAPRSLLRQRMEIMNAAMSDVLEDLLRSDMLIEGRKSLALKLAFKEYSRILEDKIELRKDRKQDNELDKLLLSGKLDGVRIFDEDELLGLNSDLQYTRSRIAKWNSLNDEQQQMIYIHLYRLLEAVLKGIGYNLGSFEANQAADINFYEVLRWLSEIKVLSNKGYEVLNHFRYIRNKVIHEPGAKLDVSTNTLTNVFRHTNDLLREIKKWKVETVSD